MMQEYRVGTCTLLWGWCKGEPGTVPVRDSSGNCILKDKCFSILKTLKVQLTLGVLETSVGHN